MNGFETPSDHDQDREPASHGSSLKKILVKGLRSDDRDLWPPVDEESLWAEDLGRGRYRIDSIPFLAKGLSLDDIVRVKEVVGDDQMPIFHSVVQRGGHSTYRVKVLAGLDADRHEAYHQLARAISEIGCQTESASPRFFSVDCPPEANVHALYDILEVGEKEGIWEFEEGHSRVNDE
jgi:Domain of unknown function (DUF4265)